jgi:hypothetical protein
MYENWLNGIDKKYYSYNTYLYFSLNEFVLLLKMDHLKMYKEYCF